MRNRTVAGIAVAALALVFILGPQMVTAVDDVGDASASGETAESQLSKNQEPLVFLPVPEAKVEPVPATGDVQLRYFSLPGWQLVDEQNKFRGVAISFGAGGVVLNPRGAKEWIGNLVLSKGELYIRGAKGRPDIRVIPVDMGGSPMSTLKLIYEDGTVKYARLLGC